MHYYGYNEYLELFDFEDFGEYISYLYTLSSPILVHIRRRLYKEKEFRRFVGTEPIFDKEKLIEIISLSTNNLSINLVNQFL